MNKEHSTSLPLEVSSNALFHPTLAFVMEYANWLWKAHFSALLELLAQAVQVPLPAQAGESLRYSLHGTDYEAGLWVEYPFPAGAQLRARFALDNDDRDIMHVALSVPPDLCKKVSLLSLKEMTD
jgi:hypothetical protein